MVTKYDIFAYLGKRNSPLKPREIMEHFNRRDYEYPNIYRILLTLVEEKLVSKTKNGYQIKLSQKTQLLYGIINYSIANGINYNYLINKELSKFISKALLKIEFTSKDFSLDPKTFAKYTTTLENYGLIIIISKKPFKARISMNRLFSSILEYFDIKVLVKKEKEVNLYKLIEKELRQFRKNISKNERKYESIVKEYEVKFIHSSLSLEGNPITLPDTIKILKQKIIPKDLRVLDVKALQNYQIALETMMNNALKGVKLTKEIILNYHYLAMQHIKRIAGKIRTVSVQIKGNPNFKIASVIKIEKLLDDLFKKYSEFINKKSKIKDIIEFAAYFHNEFQYIHPFEDGNSRTTRLIMFHIFQYYKIPILDMPFGLLDKYLENTKAYKKREDKELQKTLQMIVLSNLKSINGKF